MKNVFKLVLIIVLIFLSFALGISFESKTNDKISEEFSFTDEEDSRMILLEDHLNYKLYFDKYTNVMYFYSNKNAIFYPVYNKDGSLHLYGTDRTVG